MPKPPLDLDTPLVTLRGEPTSVRAYAGKVLLVVNTASKCGFTPQYAGLEALWKKHADAGLVVLGFPCDQFRHQEPLGDGEIESFCQINYGVTFPLFAKCDVNGKSAHALFQQLTAAAPGILGTRSIKWNFTKFLVDRQGKVVVRHAPNTKPEELEGEIVGLLAGR